MRDVVDVDVRGVVVVVVVRNALVGRAGFVNGLEAENEAERVARKRWWWWSQ